MNRRITLVAALVLTACTADLPTEPSSLAEGAPFAGVLPPVPEAPTPLSGTIPPGGGQGASIILGTYASPTYSKVTVSGTVGYSGMESGYLPGSGSVDAGGIFVPPQNRCALQVWVLGGPAWPCTTFPQQRGALIRYTTVHGTVTATMNAGPPGSCYNSPAPCVSYSGGITLTIEPVAARMILKPHPLNAVAGPGGFVTITAKGVTVEDSLKPVPFLPREWRWEGQGPVVGNGQTQVCAAYRINECVVRVHQSGHVVLEALVNGVVQTEKIWIRVIGGDTIPTPPVDTIPTDTIPTDTIPTDTIPGDGGGCGSQTAAGLFLAACDTVPVPVPTASCSPGTVTRAAAVECKVSLAPATAFTVDSMVVTAGQHVIRDLTPQTIAAGDEFKTAGPALLSSVVTLWIRFDSAGTMVTRAMNASFGVTPRQWSELDQRWLPAQLNRYTLDPYPVTVERFPRRTPSGGHAIMAGVHEPAQPDWGAIAGGAATSTMGPNKGLMYLSSAVGFAGSPSIYTTPLFGDLNFLVDQNGGRGGSRQRCTLQQFLVSYEPAVEAHEGTTQSGNSHWGIYKRELASLGLNSRVETLVLPDIPGNDPVDSVSIWYERWKRNVSNPVHAQFDVVDYPLIPGRAGCELDLDLRDP